MTGTVQNIMFDIIMIYMQFSIIIFTNNNFIYFNLQFLRMKKFTLLSQLRSKNSMQCTPLGLS